VFCFNDDMAIGVNASARRRHIRVPADLSLVGFDDIRVARHLDPPLTTIAQPMREIGENAVRLLLDILNGHTVQPLSITLPHRLVIRGSTAAASLPRPYAPRSGGRRSNVAPFPPRTMINH
jgi:LacI family repressor for deo operon, udp, cdd, tsx, nupC, and nupG